MAKHQGRCTIDFQATRYTILPELRSQFTKWFNEAKNFQSQVDLKKINIDSLRKEMEAEKETLNDEMKVYNIQFIYINNNICLLLCSMSYWKGPMRQKRCCFLQWQPFFVTLKLKSSVLKRNHSCN